MELSELSAYAGQKYHIEEQHKWADFPGFSVLAEPGSGKWAALLMRQWDGESGTELQRADIKCGRQCLLEIPVPWLALPFRMKGSNWVGVVFGPDTDPEIVCRLFDRAVASVAQQNRRQAHLVEPEPLAGGGLRTDSRRGYPVEPEPPAGVGLRTDSRRGYPVEPEPPAGVGLQRDARRGYLIELEPLRGNYQWPEEGEQDTGAQGDGRKGSGQISDIYRDTALPPRGERRPDQNRRQPANGAEPIPGAGRQSGLSSFGNYGAHHLLGAEAPEAAGASKAEGDRRLPPAQDFSIDDSGDDSPRRVRADYHDFTIDTNGLRTGGYASTAIPQVPQKIREMIRLYEYRGESIEEKCRNFYRQGKFMEDYEDDAPWTGEYRRYFTTYHDLHLPQLRGYFTWRTAVRRGEFRPIAASLAYMYVYELLCGIGASSPEDSLRKMQEFEKGFLDSGIGDSFMRRNLHHWMLDYAVIHNVPLETAQLSEIPAVAERDRQMAVLREPDRYTDEEIFRALCAFGGKKTEQSPVVTGNEQKGHHLFAELWRYLTEHYRAGTGRTDRTAGQTAAQSPEQDPEIFTACFGERQSHAWTPLTNAIHWEEDKPQEAEYVLNPCRRYRCHEGEWTEERYENPYFARDRLQGLLHAADKSFRRYLKTGHYLRAKKEEEWAEPWIEAVITADREAEERTRIEAEKEAAMAKITIDLSGLDRIRRDALVTRDSLLTESEMAEAEETGAGPSLSAVFPAQSQAALPSQQQDSLPSPAQDDGTGLPAEDGQTTSAQEAAALIQAALEEAPALLPADILPANGEQFKINTAAGEDMPENRQTPLIEGLDSLHTQILCALVRGESVAALIRENRLMPSMVADTINEALYDEIGDIVLECDGDSLTIVEDYLEDLEELTGTGR